MTDDIITIELVDTNEWKLTLLVDNCIITEFTIKLREEKLKWGIFEGDKFINAYSDFGTCLYVAYIILLKESGV